jgi:N-acetylmuramoyl-L-alanine amidase
MPRTRSTATVAALGAVLLLSACATTEPRIGEEGATWIPSPNFEERRPNFIIIHHTTDHSNEEALRTLTSPVLGVSAHYLIGRDGKLVQLVDERQRAWHAGISWWGGQTDMNSASIGIELDNDGEEPFADAQIKALIRLLDHLRARYRIPAANVLGHGDVAPGRKVDPSARFPWERLAAAGHGLWCRESEPTVPEGFDPLLGLHALGYDTRNPAAAIAAFKRHFARFDETSALTAADIADIACLLRAQQKETAP